MSRPQRPRAEVEALAADTLGIADPEGAVIPPVSSRQERLRERAEADGLSPLPRDWRRALLSAGGLALVRRARDAGIDSPEALARLSSADVARLGGWGRARLGQLRSAALAVGLDWAPDLDLERRPGAPSLSGEGESPRETVSLPPAVRAQVRARAKAEGISASAWIRRAVEAALSG